MGITYDVIPIIGGESTDNAVARVWGGDPSLDDPPAPIPADPVLVAEFRSRVLDRLRSMG